MTEEVVKKPRAPRKKKVVVEEAPVVVTKPTRIELVEKFLDAMVNNILVKNEAGGPRHIAYTSKFCASWGGVDPVNGIMTHSNTACHAGMAGSRPKFNLDVLVTVENFTGYGVNKRSSHEDDENFMDWIIKESPWAIALVEGQNAEQSLDKHFLAFRSDMPLNLVTQGMIAHRSMWEHPHIIRAWNALVRGGFNKNHAWVLAHTITMDDAGKVQYYPFHGHCSLNGAAALADGVASFITNKIHEKKKNIDKLDWRHYNNYNSTSHTFNCRDGSDRTRIIVGGAIDKANVVEVKTNNVFKKAANQVGKAVYMKDFVPSLMKVMKERCPEFLELRTKINV